MVRLLEDLNATRQADINRLKSGIRSAIAAHILEEHIHYLDDQIKLLEQLIKTHIAQDDDLHRNKHFSSASLESENRPLTPSWVNSCTSVLFRMPNRWLLTQALLPDRNYLER